LAKALLNERNEAYYDLRKAIRDQHEISLDLLRSHESDPRNLGWLARTKAKAGVLAMWVQDNAGVNENPDHGGAPDLEVMGPTMPPGRPWYPAHRLSPSSTTRRRSYWRRPGKATSCWCSR